MRRYVITRLVFLVLMLLGLLCITFVISHVAPGDPARLAAGPDATASMVETMRAKYGLDRPLPIQFMRYARGLVTGDLGESIRSLIGLGAQPPFPEWGAMISYGRNYLPTGWWYSTFPGLFIYFTVLGFNLLGDGLRDVLDPRTRL